MNHKPVKLESFCCQLARAWLSLQSQEISAMAAKYHIWENIHRGKFLCFEWKIAICGKTFAVAVL